MPPILEVSLLMCTVEAGTANRRLLCGYVGVSSTLFAIRYLF